MTKKQKKRLYRIIVAVVLFVLAEIITHVVSEGAIYALGNAIFIVSYIIVGHDVLLEAARNIRNGKVFDENFLMGIATLGAIAICVFPDTEPQFAEACAVMLFYQVGELFQSVAVDKSRKSISDLMDIRPDSANLKTDEGLKVVDPYDVKIGDTIVVKPGEKVPLDGNVIEGQTYLDTAALTGESTLRHVSRGDMVISGCVNTKGLIELEVTKEFGESTISKILDLVENASSQKSRSENFITKFAAVYTPLVVVAAVIIALVPPIFIAGHPFATWIKRALTFLVVSCPCALVISVPLSFFGGIGAASRKGILVKGSNYLEAMASASIAVFDKTGTLTKGTFEVQEIVAHDLETDELLRIAAHAECYSDHPIAVSIRKAYGKGIDESIVKNETEVSGHGISVDVDRAHVLAGNIKLMQSSGIAVDESDKQPRGTVIYIAIDNQYKGYITIADTIKEDSRIAIESLKKNGIRKTVMLTGDNEQVALEVASTLGLDEVHSQLLPAQKVEKLEELLQTRHEKEKLIFVGDGINDAPVLARADIGIAMGGLGSDAAIEAADIVIMTDEPSRIATAIKIARRTLTIAYQNIYFAIGVKVIILVLSAFGYTNMWAAVFADVGVAVIAILNSMRCMGDGEGKR